MQRGRRQGRKIVRRVLGGVATTAVLATGVGYMVHRAPAATAPPRSAAGQPVVAPALPAPGSTTDLLGKLASGAMGPSSQSYLPGVSTGTQDLVDNINRALGETGDMVNRTIDGQPFTDKEEQDGADALKYGTAADDLQEGLLNLRNRLDHENYNAWEYGTYGSTQIGGDGYTYTRDPSSGEWYSSSGSTVTTPPFFYDDVPLP